MRAFAGKLGISPATLSGVLSGKRRLTRKMAKQIALRLNLSPKDRAELLKAVNAKKAATAEDIYQVLELDTFQLISQWYHYAMLSLSELPNSNSDPEWIAKKLGILKREAEEALERMKRLKLIEENDGKYRQIAPPLATQDTLADPAIRNHTQEYLKKAEEALDKNLPEDLAYYTVVMAADPTKLEDARQSMKSFRRTVCEQLERGKKRRVYALSMQLFPVDI